MTLGRQRDPYAAVFARIEKNLKGIDARLSHLERGQHLAAHRGKILPIGEHVRELESSNQSYAQIVMLVGYGSFFALWTNTVDRMSPWMFASTGLLIAVSILSFVSFELLKQFEVSEAGVKAEKEVGFGKPIDGSKWLRYSKTALSNVNRYWKAFFFVSVTTGLSAGFSLFLWFMWITIESVF